MNDRTSAHEQVVTPELRQWIIEQARAGHAPEQVLQAMVRSGWHEAVAIEALEETLASHLQETLGSQAEALMAAARAPAPDPALAPGANRVSARDREVRVVMSLADPRIVVFADFLSDDECDALRALAEPRLLRSQTVDIATGGSEVNEARTSCGMFFARGENELVSRIEARIAALVHWPVENGEGIQVLHYGPGAEYKAHHDYFDPAQPGTATILRRGGQRVGTLVMYLNTPEQGGGTSFPDIHLEVAARKGSAVFFGYERPDPSTRTLHGGMPVLAGEKWVATKWMRERRFD